MKGLHVTWHMWRRLTHCIATRSGKARVRPEQLAKVASVTQQALFVDSVRATSVNKGRTSFVHSRRRLVGRTLAAVVCAEVDRDELWRHRGCCERLVEQVVDLVVAPPWVSVVVDPLLGNIRRTRLESPHRRHVESLLAIIVAKAVEASESAAWCMWHLRNLHKLFCTMTGTNEQQ